ncbi:DUF2336 domain-containing protein [Pseudaminobacter arsenicus]|uniref:DUF2336 domain-containing protein n=1 Tax=Borborobacter arsenicus TaxID=1851146 RepID=A0A432V5B6_9HYPH|nr:DUF2336 domain-containing protein [Pseudaminobacter arsenicus]RUM97351.1 DUF2336 domain-containing protein [Pseudaminobacter arsenicus]
MSSSEFRQLAMKGEAGKAERLFRAAVSAFCSLTRPSRREIAQFEDLAVPLFDMVSLEARRFAAAALSECEYAPIALVRLLGNQPVDVAAPLIIRSPVLRDIDLIALIGRHGLAHARVIARRANLNPAISDLIRALENPKLVRLPISNIRPQQADQALEEAGDDSTGNSARPLPGTSAENARRRLRSMMVSSSPADQRVQKPHPVSSYVSLRDAALSGDAGSFAGALAKAIGIAAPAGPALAEASGSSSLMALLRYLYLTEERAFLVMAAAFPGRFSHVDAIRGFIEDYRRIDPAKAEAVVSQWKSRQPSSPVEAKSPFRLRAS